MIMLSRARYCWVLAGLELSCDVARLQFRSFIKRGERRGGIASGPAVAAGRLLVGGEPGAELPRRLSRFAASDLGLSSWAYAADFGVVS